MANLFDLSSISTIGSSGFLIIFGLVNLANFKLYRKTGGNRALSLLGAIMAFFAVAILFREVITTDLQGVGIFVAMVVLAFFAEWLYRKITGRELKPLLKVPI